MTEKRKAALMNLSQVQIQLVLYARSYYYQLYFMHFRKEEVRKLTDAELMSDVLINNNVYLTSPGYLCAQVMLRILKGINSNPKKSAESLIKTYKTIKLNFFAFSTFPAIFEYFTTAESAQSGAQFILDLLSLDAPVELLEILLTSLMFSAYVFTDALWTNAHYRLGAKRRITEMQLACELGVAVSNCSPLLPNGLAHVIQEVFKKDSQLMCRVFLKFLSVTFDIWHEHSDDGSTFGCGNVVKEFFEKAENFYSGNMITLLANLLRRDSRIPIIPTFTTVKGISSESVIFSRLDFEVFKAAFKCMSKDFALYDEIKIEEESTRFSPYAINYFPNSQKRRSNYEDFPMFTTEELSLFTLKRDSIFEQAIVKNVKIQGREFEEYTLKKSILDYQRDLIDLEDYLDLKLKDNQSHDFLKSITKYRSFCFARRAREMFAHTKLPPNMEKVQETVRSMFGDFPERTSLFWSLIGELLNHVWMKEPNDIIVDRYTTIRDATCSILWVKMAAYPGMKYLMQVIPELGGRKVTGFGNKLKMFTNVLKKLRIVHTRFKDATTMDDLLKFGFMSVEYPKMMKAFLFFEKIAFRSEFMMNLMPAEVPFNWNCFFRMIWSVIASDDELLTEITKFVAEEREKPIKSMLKQRK